MAISPYPRRGRRIAPLTLRDWLQKPLPPEYQLGAPRDGILLLCDLDERSWDLWSPSLCSILGSIVIQRVSTLLATQPSELLRETAPSLPPEMVLHDLDLSQATLRALEHYGRSRVGQHNGFDWLRGITIGTFLRNQQIGPGQLVDYLVAVEHANAHYAMTATSISHSGIGIATGPKLPNSHSSQAIEAFQPVVVVPSDSRTAADPGSTEETKAAVSTLLNEIGHLQIATNDPRLVEDISKLQAFGHGAKTLRQILLAIHSDGSADQNDTVLKSLKSLHYNITRMKQLSLEAELHELAACVSTRGGNADRNGEIVARRLGWDGAGQRTLKVIGDEFGISRERARQICEKAMKGFGKEQVFLPVLDRTLELIAAALPADVTFLEESLCVDGVTRGRFQLAGIIATAESFGRELPFSLNKRSGLITARGGDAAAQPIQVAIRTAAKKTVAHWGVASVAEVVETLRSSGKEGVTDKRVREALRSQDWVTWLDQSHLWFWNKGLKRNPLLRDVDKILSVCHDIGVSELREGVSRNYRKQGFAPPRQILLEICRQAGWYLVAGGRVSDGGKLDCRTVLPGVELKMVEVLQSHGPLLPTAEFEALCDAEGMVRSTFYVYLKNSPIISKFARGVYGLRGVDVPAGLVESQKSTRSRGKSLVDYGWTSDGRIRVEHRLTLGAIAGGVVSIPSSFSDYLEGNFSLVVDGNLAGTVSIRGGAAWGFGPILRSAGCQAGDRLVLTFDLGSQDVSVTVESPKSPSGVCEQLEIRDDNYPRATLQPPEGVQILSAPQEEPDLQDAAGLEFEDQELPSLPSLDAPAADAHLLSTSVSTIECVEKPTEAGFGEDGSASIPTIRLLAAAENETSEEVRSSSVVERTRSILRSIWKCGRGKR